MKNWIILFLILVSLQGFSQAMPAGWQYIEKYRDVAIAEMNRSGVPASITLAQGIHESAFGKSELAIKANNHFGIKCHQGWEGDRYHHDDDAPQECFRVYRSADESFRDHSDFLRTRKHYAKLFELSLTDYKGWARGLKAAGYATNPKYPDIIIKLVEDYQLHKLDLLANLEVPANTAQSLPTNAVSLDEILRDVPEAQYYSNIEMEERTVNGVKAVVYKNGLRLADVAQKYNLSITTLYEFNDMKAGAAIKEEQFIFVQPKKNESTYHQYELADGETMHDVAQKFGVKLSELYKRNGITENCVPLSGEVVVLRGTREVPIRFKLKATSAVTPARVERGKIHQVGGEDTLYSIAQRYNIDVDNLRKLNGLKGDDIQVGQKLIVDL